MAKAMPQGLFAGSGKSGASSRSLMYVLLCAVGLCVSFYLIYEAIRLVASWIVSGEGEWNLRGLALYPTVLGVFVAFYLIFEFIRRRV
jgi:hypothetical protein